MLGRRHWLHRPWIPFLKAVEGDALLKRGIKGPVLDMACGDGVFTSCVFPERFEAGFDLAIDDLNKAKKAGTHKALARGSAYDIPFKSGQFQTVISVCAIEHMPELDSVLKETARVLKVGGRFVFTVPSVYFGEYPLTPTIYNALGLKDTARRYADRKNARSQHYHVLTVQEWERRLKDAGLEVSYKGYTLSRRVMLIWSFMGSVFFKPLMYPFRWLKSDAADRLLERLLTGLLGGVVKCGNSGNMDKGGYLVIEAVKKAS